MQRVLLSLLFRNSTAFVLWVLLAAGAYAQSDAYGPATGLPDTKVGAFTQALYDEATSQGWIVISMKKDWKRIFAFEE